jgi:cystathionine beta-lyase/cystathionine gamma-synthase
MTTEPHHLDTTAIRAGRSANGTSLAPPLWGSSVWTSPTLDVARKAAVGARAACFYGRFANPTVTAFEEAIATLEGAESALAFASGMGAVSAVILALCSSGDHVVAQRQIYSGTQMFLQAAAARFGIETTFVDGAEPGAFAAAVRPGKTMLILAETPANPVMSLVDLHELGAITGPFKVVDSTFATPCLQQPLRHGIDIVLHSATKGIAGHNDATLGVIAGEQELMSDIWRYAVLHGATPSPADALNALRGIRTMPIRVARQSATALHLARFLEGHAAVSRVNFPGLESHPQHDLAKRQMSDFGGVLSFDLAGGVDAARRFVESVSLAQMATSLGGPETLVTSPALTTHAGLGPDDQLAAGITPGLVRVSVGLEHESDLVADFTQAFTSHA